MAISAAFALPSVSVIDKDDSLATIADDTWTLIEDGNLFTTCYYELEQFSPIRTDDANFTSPYPDVALLDAYSYPWEMQYNLWCAGVIQGALDSACQS